MRKRKDARSRLLVILLVMAFVQFACAQVSPGTPTPAPSVSPTDPVATLSTPAVGLLQVYFTDPTAPHASDYQGGPDVALVAALNQARLSVDVAAYSLNLWSIRDALINAHKRGVVVRMVMESDNMDNPEVQQIKDTGIPIVGDQRQGLMHNKFIVIDRLEVWTGSMNYTLSGVYKDNNNLIHIRSSEVAEDYTTEFHQMFTYALFGPDKSAGTPHPKGKVAGMPIEIYFSPQDNPAGRILELIINARQSIYFLAYSFTSNDFGDVLVSRAESGVFVSGVMDDGQAKTNTGSEYEPLVQAGLDVRLDGNQTGLMHHKVIIIDQQIVITGSYNFTNAAQTTNDENVVIIFSPQVAAQYMQEFQRVYAQAQVP
jgi:phosphatidylserine/phosphatidylglycerophosphate/cardiolipin synthase-like enzyme